MLGVFFLILKWFIDQCWVAGLISKTNIQLKMVRYKTCLNVTFINLQRKNWKTGKKNLCYFSCRTCHCLKQFKCAIFPSVIWSGLLWLRMMNVLSNDHRYHTCDRLTLAWRWGKPKYGWNRLQQVRPPTWCHSWLYVVVVYVWIGEGEKACK